VREWVQHVRGDRVADGWGEARGRIISYTHEENLVSLHGNISLVLEDVRKPEQPPSIARGALWEHSDGAVCSFPHILQTLIFLLVVGGLGGDPPRVADH